MMYVIVLICAVSVMPQDCAETNAVQFEKLSGAVSSPWECWRKGQTWAAQHVEVGEGHYMLVRCSASFFGFPT
jgi:hypothetical protein